MNHEDNREAEGRWERLHQLVKDCQGDVADAVRAFSGRTTSELADDMDLPRQSVEQCLKVANGRRYPHIRVALESELGLPPGSMTKILATVRRPDVAH